LVERQDLLREAEAGAITLPARFSALPGRQYFPYFSMH
jgi:hypothetical protein